MGSSDRTTRDPSAGTAAVIEFARTASLSDNSEVATTVRRRVVDTLAAITAGYRHVSGEVVRDHALANGTDGEATILDGSGRQVALADATLANATAANVLDIDDGHRAVKGHPAAVVVPAALAAAEVENASVEELLDAVYVGYEIAVRTALTIHAVDEVYSGTGSWGAVGAAAAVGRLREFDPHTMGAALGTAEYHAPRTPVMRAVEQPGMTKDGIGWGSYAGVEAATMSDRGFTASGTVFDESVTHLGDFRTRHHVTESYLKPYPCCRWAHPGIDAVREIVTQHDIDAAAIERIIVKTFEEATHLHTRRPDSLEAAEYSYPYPVAVTALHGDFTEADLTPERREDPLVQSLADCVDLVTSDQLVRRFPEECLAKVTIETNEESCESDVVKPRGAADRPLSATAFQRKVERLFSPSLTRDVFETVDVALTHLEETTRSALRPWR
jgi:2-methylcitrate dehydratase PrpD